MGAFESEKIVERAAAAAGFGMMVVVAPQFDFPEQGVDAPGAVAVAGLEGEEGRVVGQQGAVVVEGGDDFAAVAQEGVAQAQLDPLGAVAGTRGAQVDPGLGDEGFGFGELFRSCFRVEFFLPSWAEAADVSAARRAMVCWMLSSASCPQSWLKV